MKRQFFIRGRTLPIDTHNEAQEDAALVAYHKPGYNSRTMNTATGPILVVEDVPTVLELLEVALRIKGYAVITARNGLEALKQVQKEHPALVITDILMPKMDGYALAYRLRSAVKTRKIPLIFLSATYITREDKQFAINLGAVRFIEKPIDTEEFLLTVAEQLTQGREWLPEPLGEGEFYSGYRERLEQKLRHKNTQVARAERLLTSLPDSQRPAFETLLKQAQADGADIQAELAQIDQVLHKSRRK